MYISDGDKNSEVTLSHDQLIHTVNKSSFPSKNSGEELRDLNVEASDESSSSTSCTCFYSGCADNYDNMEYTDEPESDNEFTEGSDEDSWRDIDDAMFVDQDEDEDDVDIASYHDDDWLELMVDNFSDLSEDDTPQAEDNNDNNSVGIEIDMNSSSSSETSGSDGESEDFYIDESEVQQDYYDEDNDVDVGDEEYGAMEPFDDDDDEEDDDDDDDDDGNSDYDDVETSQITFQTNYGSRLQVSVAPVTITRRQPLPVAQVTSVPVALRSVNTDSIVSSQQTEPSPKEASDVKPSSSSSLPINDTDEQNDGSCCICLDSHSNHVVVPCGHICLCQDCSQLLLSSSDKKKKKCPLCKTKFSLIIKVYK